MFKLQHRKLLGQNLRNHASPKSTRRQNIRLIQRPHFTRRVLGQRQVRCQPGNSFDFLAGVWLAVLGGFVLAVGRVGFATLAEVDSACEFADYGEVCVSADFLF